MAVIRGAGGNRRPGGPAVGGVVETDISRVAGPVPVNRVLVSDYPVTVTGRRSDGESHLRHNRGRQGNCCHDCDHGCEGISMTDQNNLLVRFCGLLALALISVLRCCLIVRTACVPVCATKACQKRPGKSRQPSSRVPRRRAQAQAPSSSRLEMEACAFAQPV